MTCPFRTTPLLALLCVAGASLAQSPYRMEGVVVNAETQAPMASATVPVLIESETEPDDRVRKSVTCRR